METLTAHTPSLAPLPPVFSAPNTLRRLRDGAADSSVDAPADPLLADPLLLRIGGHHRPIRKDLASVRVHHLRCAIRPQKAAGSVGSTHEATGQATGSMGRTAPKEKVCSSGAIVGVCLVAVELAEFRCPLLVRGGSRLEYGGGFRPTGNQVAGHQTKNGRVFIRCVLWSSMMSQCQDMGSVAANSTCPLHEKHGAPGAPCTAKKPTKRTEEAEGAPCHPRASSWSHRHGLPAPDARRRAGWPWSTGASRGVLGKSNLYGKCLAHHRPPRECPKPLAKIASA